MANIKKGARAYYADTDYRRDGTIEAYNKIDGMPAIPTPTTEDVGKIIKINDNGDYALSDDLHTPVIANPEGTPTADLNSITIGDTIYKVNDARVSKILALRFTIDNGGTYNANLPQISLVNEYDEAAVLPTNTMTCDKPVQYGSLTPTGTPGVLTENLPAKITLTFAAEFNVEDYPNIKLTKSGLFPQDIAKNIKIEYSLNSEDWVEIADLVSIDWTGDSHVYDMSTGEEITTKSPIPEPTAADAGKVLTVDNNGAWVLDKSNVVFIDATTDVAGSPTSITLTNLTCRQLLAMDLTKEYVIRAKDSNGNINLFHQMRVTISEVQNSMNFFSLGMQYGAVNRIFSCSVLPSDSSTINVTSITLATQ